MAEARARHVLVVEDEKAIAKGLVFNLKRKGYEVDLAEDGGEALEKAGSRTYDLIVLDVRLPVHDGFVVCQRLRRDGLFTPVLMLTARDQPDDIVYGLKSGADDYMVKPFDLAIFLTRVEALLRRAQWSTSGAPEEEKTPRLVFGDYWVDFGTWQAQTRQGLVELSRKELAVMRVFADRANQVVTREELLDKVWELPNHPNTRVVDNVIVALRRAFEKKAGRPRHIHSVRGVGYRFEP